MTAYSGPRRVKSTATTITVQSATTTLSAAAAAAASGAFTQFDGNGLSTQAAHPTSGILCNVVQDGAAAGHTAIDWGAKGCYDSTTRRVMWASTGAGVNIAGGYVYNTQAIYSETANGNAGLWSATRGFQSPNASNTNGLVHLYDSLCIDVTGRRFYKQKLSENLIFVFDLDTNAWISGITGAPQDASLRTGALEIVTSRNAMWCYGRDAGGTQRLWEMSLASPGTWSQIGSFGTGTTQGLPMSYNPRSDRVFCGGMNGSAYIVNPSTLGVTTIAHPNPSSNSFMVPYRAHLCRDPAGTGWLYFDAYDTGRVYQCSSSGTWTNVAAMPADMPAGDQKPFIVTPIDAYGVVWLVRGTNTGGASVAGWLYKP